MTMRAPLSAVAAVCAAALAAPAAAQTSGPAPPVPSARATGDIDVNNGRFVALGGFYGQGRIDCVRCHGIDGTGNSSGAFPRLTDQSAWYLYKSLRDYASGFRPNGIMAPIARMLSEEEMQNVAAYYAAIEDAPYPAAPEPDPQALHIGRVIAEHGIPAQGVPSCVSCHGPGGIGDAPLYPYLAGQFAPYLEHQLILWKKGIRDGDPQNVMELIAKAMTEDQIRAVSAYFASLRPPEVTPLEGRFEAVAGVWKLPAAIEPRPPLEPPLTVFRGNPTSIGAGPAIGERRDLAVVPGAEPSMTPPAVSLPAGLPRRPLPPDALPPYLSPPPLGGGLDATTTTTGQRPGAPQ